MSGATTRVPLPGRSGGPYQGAGLSHPGRVRTVNEDAVLTDPGGLLWAVADGVGGYGHGDVAAEIAVDCLARIPHDGATGQSLVAALVEANREIREWAGRSGVARMGATAVAALIGGGGVSVAWVGDSRAYLLRGDALRRLTRDHSLVQDLLDQGRITPAEAEQHPESNVITRALGALDEVSVATTTADLAVGDVLLLCSDGLTRCVPDGDIAAVLATRRRPEAMCRRLVEAALERGAPDNVSVVVVLVGGAGLT